MSFPSTCLIIIFCNEHMLPHCIMVHLRLQLEIGFLSPWQISTCMTADRCSKMAALERRTCASFLRNWHHHVRFTIDALVHFVTSTSLSHYLLDYSIRCICYVKMLLHLCIKPVSTSLTAHYCQTDRASLEMTPPPPPTVPTVPIRPHPSSTTTTGYCSVAQQGYGCMETCRGRLGTKIRRRIKKQEAGGGRRVIRSPGAQREGLCSLWPASYTNTILT